MACCPLLLIVAAACCAALAAPGPAVPATAPAAASGPSLQGTGEGAGRAKRYVAALARNGDLPFPARAQWHKKLHPAVSVHRGWQAAISPLGPLNNPSKRLADGSDDISDEALDEQLEAASRAEAAAAEALAAAAAALAAAEVADSAAAEAAEAAEAEDAAMVPAEDQPDNRSAEQKRGGVAALARQGIRPGAPWPEKRSLAALARAGGLSALRYAGAKKNDMLTSNSEKRASPPPLPDTLETLEALEALDRPLETPPLGWWGPVDNSWTEEGKRHLGALRRQGRRRRDLLAADYDDLAPLPAAKRFLAAAPADPCARCRRRHPPPGVAVCRRRRAADADPRCGLTAANVPASSEDVAPSNPSSGSSEAVRQRRWAGDWTPAPAFAEGHLSAWAEALMRRAALLHGRLAMHRLARERLPHVVQW